MIVRRLTSEIRLPLTSDIRFLNDNPLNLIERYLVAGAVIELRRARALVRRHQLSILQSPAVAGSTRLKSGTGQKLVLNMLTTGSMIRSGKCYQNLMVDLKPTNMKLVARAARIVMQATGCTTEQAQEVLKLTGNDVELAILITVTGMPLKRAKMALESAGGFLRKAIA